MRLINNSIIAARGVEHSRAVAAQTSPLELNAATQPEHADEPTQSATTARPGQSSRRRQAQTQTTPGSSYAAGQTNNTGQRNNAGDASRIPRATAPDASPAGPPTPRRLQ